MYIILLVRNPGKDDIRAGLEADTDSYVTRPFDSAELVVRVQAGESTLQRSLERQESTTDQETEAR